MGNTLYKKLLIKWNEQTNSSAPERENEKIKGVNMRHKRTDWDYAPHLSMASHLTKAAVQARHDGYPAYWNETKASNTAIEPYCSWLGILHEIRSTSEYIPLPPLDPKGSCSTQVGYILPSNHRLYIPRCIIYFCRPFNTTNSILLTISCVEYMEEKFPEDFPERGRKIYRLPCRHCKPVADGVNYVHQALFTYPINAKNVPTRSTNPSSTISVDT